MATVPVRYTANCQNEKCTWAINKQRLGALAGQCRTDGSMAVINDLYSTKGPLPEDSNSKKRSTITPAGPVVQHIRAIQTSSHAHACLTVAELSMPVGLSHDPRLI